MRLFLERHKREGLMACLSFLSDEEVLPRLTGVMRDLFVLYVEERP